MSVLIFVIILYVLNGVSMMKLFEKAGIPANKALIPGVAAVEWCKMVGRKPWYALWLLVPVVNIFIYAGLCIDMIRSFGKHGFWESVVAVVYAPIQFFLIGNSSAKYNGPILEQERAYHQEMATAMEKKDERLMKKLSVSPFKKTVVREWAEAIIFAVFAAAFIRMFVFEAYVIPTSSMEGTLKVGDFLFVSKPSYGLRLPMTVLQFPLVHNRFSQSNKGFLARESYLESPSLPYKRLPGWEKIERNKPVVFNFPAGDSVIVQPGRTWDIYQWRRMGGRPSKVVTRPLDKKDHYIKRCVAISGDSVQVIGGQLYVNGQAASNPTHLQYAYKVTGVTLSPQNIDDLDITTRADETNPSRGTFNLDNEQIGKIKAMGSNVEITRVPANNPIPNYVFPNNDKALGTKWTVDDYGPIFIPKAGVTVALTPQSMAFYGRIISVFEHNELKVVNGKYFINGQEATTYTFKQDYYWMMGDNRNASEDCRIWGYVPADHIVGKPVLVWFSTKENDFTRPNWKRMFLLPGNM